MSQFGLGFGLRFDQQLVHRLPPLKMASIFPEIVVLVRIRLQFVQFGLTSAAPFRVPPPRCAAQNAAPTSARIRRTPKQPNLRNANLRPTYSPLPLAGGGVGGGPVILEPDENMPSPSPSRKREGNEKAYTAFITSDALVPPKPNELFSTARTFRSLAFSGTTRSDEPPVGTGCTPLLSPYH